MAFSVELAILVGRCRCNRWSDDPEGTDWEKLARETYGSRYRQKTSEENGNNSREEYKSK